MLVFVLLLLSPENSLALIIRTLEGEATEHFIHFIHISYFPYSYCIPYISPMDFLKFARLPSLSFPQCKKHIRQIIHTSRRHIEIENVALGKER
jgi:hypothetical protein